MICKTASIGITDPNISVNMTPSSTTTAAAAAAAAASTAIIAVVGCNAVIVNAKEGIFEYIIPTLIIKVTTSIAVESGEI